MSYDYQPRRRGQEEGNARLIVETNSGVIAQSPREVVAHVQRAFDDGAKQWRNGPATSASSAATRSTRYREFLMSL